jgi:hypothetical protein
MKTYLQGQLPSVQHSTLEGVRFILEIRFSSLTRRDQVFENRRQQALASVRGRKQV